MATSVASSAMNPKQGALLQAATMSLTMMSEQISLISFWVSGDVYLVEGSPWSRCSLRTPLCLARYSSIML